MTHMHWNSRRALRFLRRALLAIAYLSAVVLVPLSFGFANYYNQAVQQALPFQAPVYSGALPAPPAPDSNKKIAVVLAGARGAEITDTLPPFEILARSGVFNVYSVAPQRTVLPLSPGPVMGASGLDFVPHFSFSEYDALIGTPPDVIVVPAVPNYTPEGDAALVDWIRVHVGPNTTMLVICDGSMIAADTGLLDGRTVTTNPGDFEYVESHASGATLLQNLRYVDNGNIVTSSAVSSGIDATLHLVDRFASRATALDVAGQIGYPYTAALDDPRFAPPENARISIGLVAGYEAPQQLGVLLYDGMSEFSLAALLDTYLGSASTKAFVMAPERTIVQSLDGFLFVPRHDFSSVPALDRVLVAGGPNDTARLQVVTAWSAIPLRKPAEDIYQKVGSGEGAYDATLQDLARTRNAGLAIGVAHALFYPGDSEFQDAAWPVSEVLTALTLSLLGAAVVFGATHVRFSRRARLQPLPDLAAA